jgi:uncharacterized protein (TIGR02271 family)
MQTEIRNLLDCRVVGSDGQQVGKVGQVYLSDRTGEPEWVTVKTGFFGTKESFVPLTGAQRSSGMLRVPFDKEKIKGAPAIDDSDDRLTLEEEASLYRYYGMQPSSVPTQRKEGQGAGPATPATGRPANGRPEAARPEMGRSETGRPEMRQPGMGRPDAPRPGPGTGAAAGMTGATGQKPGRARDEDIDTTRSAEQMRAGSAHGEDIDMTRSEEQMHVGKERRESGHVRLRKYVESENVEETIPLERDEVVIEREPIVGGKPVHGHEFGEDEEETFTLYEERPVVGTESTPVERVHMRKEKVSRDETVRGKVRKERFEVDRDGETVDEGERPLRDQPRRDERRDR